DGLLGFWKLTCHIISQKAIDRRRKQAAQKRPQIVRDATACDDESGIAQVLLQTASRERAPDEEIAVKDYFDDLYARLPEDCRSVFALWVQGLTADEIGAALGHDRSWAWRKIDKIKRWWRKESDS
ncbi:MAG TPA: ECF-type sigma factor, partial [Pirellulaceae bacterium]|nr:ECF-type sigma factor [Pirellulaceae bacterium]